MTELQRSEFAWRVAVAVGIVAATIVVLLVLWASRNAILLLFASLLFALFLRGLSDRLARRTGLHESLSLALTVAGLAGLGVGLTWLFAPAAIAQASALAKQFPAEIKRLYDGFAATPVGTELGLTGDAGALVGADRVPGMIAIATALVARAVAVMGTALLIIPAGVLFAAQPSVYVDGLMRLLPERAHGPARRLAQDLETRLTWWLIGQSVTVAIISLLTGIGLWIQGIPLALILALLRGGLSVIPNIGPVVAVIPGLVIAASMGGHALARVAVIYGVLQLLEAYVLTPVIDRRTVDMPPMLLIGAQLILGMTLGIAGVVLAAPLTVVMMVVVESLVARPPEPERA